MSTPLPAADRAVEALARANPMLLDVVAAREVVPFLDGAAATHAGAPIEPERMCAPMRAALGTALTIEGLAGDPAEALALVAAGDIAIAPNHDHGGVGPMSGVVTGSMPVLLARDEASGATAWCPLNEGSGKVLRYGAFDAEVVARLRWMRDELAPALARALHRAGPLDLIALQEEALRRGDECHHRTEAATALVHEAWEAELPGDCADFIAGNGQFALNLAMVCAKAALAAVGEVPGSSLVTVVARNGVEVGVKLAGTGDRWFVGPAALPDPANLYPGFSPADMNPDLGDSAIVEVYGLGALAVAASPTAASSVGLAPSDAEATTTRLRAIGAADHPSMTLGDDGLPAILGVDARAVVHERQPPPIHTGIAHRDAGVGQIGGGVTIPPLVAFEEAVAALGG